MPLKKMKGTSLLVLVLVLVFGNIAVVYSGLPKSNGGGKEELTPSYSIGSALRYLSKGVFTNALAKGEFLEVCNQSLKHPVTFQT